MPLLSGAELARIVRSPGVFPVPDVPIIMLSGHGERWRVLEAVQLGVNEYLVKSVSAKALYDRLVTITAQRALEISLDADVLGRLDEIFPGHRTAPEDYAW